MGKPRPKHPFQDNAFAEGFLDWTDSPAGQSSIEVSDALWELMENEDVQLDARQHKILWPNGNGISIDQSVERIQKLYPNFPSQRIVTFLISWIEQYAPETYSEKQLDELDRLTEEWIDQYERQAKSPVLPRTRYS